MYAGVDCFVGNYNDDRYKTRESDNIDEFKHLRHDLPEMR